MAKKRRVRRGVFAMEYIRRVVLDMTQKEMADLLGCSLRTVFTYENQVDIDVDTLPLHYIRLACAEAATRNIPWPDSLTAAILAGNLMITEITGVANTED